MRWIPKMYACRITCGSASSTARSSSTTCCCACQSRSYGYESRRVRKWLMGSKEICWSAERADKGLCSSPVNIVWHRHISISGDFYWHTACRQNIVCHQCVIIPRFLTNVRSTRLSTLAEAVLRVDVIQSSIIHSYLMLCRDTLGTNSRVSTAPKAIER